MKRHTTQITLIQKDAVSVTPIPVRGDSSMGNLTRYRSSAKYRDTINEITKNAQITLRCPRGLFDNVEPILTDEATKDRYLVQVQMTQDGNQGQLFRFEISGAQANTGKRGKHVTLTLTGYDIRTEEFVDSENILLATPNEAFGRRIINFTTQRDLTQTGSIKITYVDSQNLLPNDQRLRQDWRPTTPTNTKKLLSKIIRNVSSPHVLGSTNEDWYYDIVPQADTESFRVFVDRLGSVDSGVILDVQTDNVRILTNEIDSYFDNRKFKNIIIMKGRKGTHTIPMGLSRLASDLEHARIAPVWSVGQQFNAGDYARSANGYYKCLVSNTADASNAPITSSIHWLDLGTDIRGSEFTRNIGVWKASMAASQSPPEGFVGFFYDFNIVRRQYDTEDPFSFYDTVSVKDVESFQISPPASPDHGKRWLVNGGTGAWQGHNNQIAEYDASARPPVWRFSNDPVAGDIVNVLDTANVLRFDGTSYQVIWSVSINPQVSSPFHPVQSIRTIQNRNRLNKAVEFEFNWNTFDAQNIGERILDLISNVHPSTPGLRLLGTNLTDFVSNTVSALLDVLGQSNNDMLMETFGVGNIRNSAGRWYGWSIELPLPKRDVDGNEKGSLIKNSTMDFVNLGESIVSGLKGWNNGKDSEDLGNIRGVGWWVKLLHLNHADQEIDGIANKPMIFWFRDIAHRIAYFKFRIRAHNEWQKIIIPAGPESNLEIFDSRIDELFTAFGYTFPFNHFIKERELTGVKFDWEHVTGMGCFNQESYDGNFLYNAGQNAYISTITEQATQVFKNLAVYTGGLIDVERIVTDRVRLAIDDLHFVKDSYVTTSDSREIEPRMKVIETENLWDYVDLAGIGIRALSRMQYHPEKQTIYCVGDTRLKAGQRFTLNGSYGSSKVLVATEVEHIEDSTGYHCAVTAIRKYEP